MLYGIFLDSVHEEFIGFTPATALDAESIIDFIISKISKWGIRIENCVAQAYDGASVMSGTLSGVQTRTREVVE